jgi:hypothetical protein
MNTNERRAVVYDRIRLDPTLYEPVGERRPERSPEELAGRCFTIEADLEEEGIIVYGYPDYEARNKDVPMVLKISDGMSQGEFLFYLQAIEDEARSDWDDFQLMIDRHTQLTESLDGADGGEHEDTD